MDFNIHSKDHCAKKKARFFFRWPERTNITAFIAMKLTFLFVLTFSFATFGKTFSQQVTLSVSHAPLSKVMQEIRKQTGFSFIVNGEDLSQAKQVTANLNNATIEESLAVIFENQPFTYHVKDQTIVLKFVEETGSQVYKLPFPQSIITGSVVDSLGISLVGASVRIAGTNRAVITDQNGRFEIKDVPGDARLIISYLGYVDREVVPSSADLGVIVLTSLPSELDAVDVVHTGYQSLPKERATGSYSIVTQEDLAAKIQTNLLSRLEGLAAGFTSYKGAYRIRGTATLAGRTAPLYVVDGFPFEGSINAINTWDVESVTVLKDATAASIYGARSANGVVVIQTKRGNPARTEVEYNSTFRTVPLPDQRDYLNLMSSRELVDFQVDMFNLYHTPFRNLNPKLHLNEVRDLLYQHESGTLTDQELQVRLDEYRNFDNRQELIDNFLRKSTLNQQHTLSIRGGANKHRYVAGINYYQSNPTEKAQSSNRLGYNLRNSYQILNWLDGDIGLLGMFSHSDYADGFSASGYLYGSRPSYSRLFNADGSPAPWYREKSQSEIERLVSLGLYDETFYPLEQLNKQQYTSRSNYVNLNLGLNAKLFKDLSVDFKYQLENTYGYIKQFRDRHAYAQVKRINDATVINHNTGAKTHYVPEGGYISERRSDAPAYTLRAQLNYNKTFNGKHAVYGIAGAERRAIKNTFTFLEKWGYDNTSLAHKYIDEIVLSKNISGTESINGVYTHSAGSYPTTFGEDENRFLAFYANASYDYDRRYAVSGSIRIDQSNLFGSDPKLQYKPLWSTGASWRLSEEHFMNHVDWVDNLTLRATHGINGNIAKESGPFLIVSDAGINPYTQEYSSRISSPPNSGLTWEKTTQTNFGLDFSVFRDRLRGSFDYYIKNTNDLLGDIVVDPTSGWNTLTLNYASMYNKGYEISLVGNLIAKEQINWRTSLNFSANKNQVTKVENSNNTVSGYLNGDNIREGLAMRSIFSTRWAGLNEQGRPQAYLADGETITTTSADLTVDDLVLSGTSVPIYAASLSNMLTAWNFRLSFMFMFYGGHVMHDVMPSFITNPEAYTSNIDKNIMNYWKEPGDENDPSVSPAPLRNAAASITTLWYGADKHILKADYVKLREIVVGYALPREAARKIGLQALSVQFQVENPWYWANNNKGLHPESWNGNYSGSSRTSLVPVSYTLGLSLTY